MQNMDGSTSCEVKLYKTKECAKIPAKVQQLWINACKLCHGLEGFSVSYPFDIYDHER